MVASSVAGISPCYRGRNGYLLFIGWKYRFLRVENVENEWTERKQRTSKKIVAVIPSANTVRALPWQPTKHVNKQGLENN